LSKPGALIARSKQWLSQTDARWNDQDKIWTFPSGASLAFGYLEHDGDEENYQSAEFQFVGFDELTHFSEAQYLYLFSRLRRLEGIEIPLRLCGASNPGSRGHAWVRDRLVEGRAPNRVFIPAKVDDNEHLDQLAYLASLSHLSETLQAQLREGNWDAFEGLAYPKFRKDIHVVPPFPLSDTWERLEALDYGINNPTSWGCFAVDFDGNVIAHGLYYSPGMVSDHAAAIHERRKTWWPERTAWTCYAPPDIKTRWGKRDTTGRELSAETEFNDHGLTFATAQNDRRAGYARVLEMLKPDPNRAFPPWHPRAGQPGSPRFFIMDKPELEPLVAQVRDAPLEEPDAPLGRLPGEAVDLRWESDHGHAHAMLRYALMSRPQATERPAYDPDPRKRALRDVMRRNARVGAYDW
jgi:hypothetical protein